MFDSLLPSDAYGLIASLAVGLLIGLERGWSSRELPEGSRVAGLRTFALTGLLGGVLGRLGDDFGPWPLLGVLLGLLLLLTLSYSRMAQRSGDLGITTIVAMVLTLLLGVLASLGDVTLALAAAVVTAVLLDLKPTLHGWLALIEKREMSAALQLLVLSVVILPYLPNTGMGPYGALNPYELWWAVILIASLSLIGHVAMRLTGAQRGVFWTGLLGGLVSSTAATLALARFVRGQAAVTDAAIAGTLAASGVMFFRMAVLLAVIDPSLLKNFGAALAAGGIILLAMALWKWRRLPVASADGAVDESINPYGLGTALGFAVFLAIMAVLVPAARQWLGSSGVYLLSLVSGFADVDAILISLARQHDSGGLPAAVASWALGLAVVANMLTKAGIAWVTGGARLGKAVVGGYLLSTVCAAALLALMIK